MKDKKNLIIMVLGLVVIILAVLLVLAKKDVKSENTQTATGNASAVNVGNDITYECTKEIAEDNVKTNLKVVMVRDNEGSIKSFKTGTVNTYGSQEKYDAMINWAKENNIQYEELGDLSLYQYTDISKDYSDVWFKNILDFYKKDGYNCTTK